MAGKLTSMNNLNFQNQQIEPSNDFVTHISDIPIYDVLEKKHFASPDIIELQRKNFELNDLKPSPLKREKWSFDPILSFHAKPNNSGHNRFVKDQCANLQANVQKKLAQKEKVEKKWNTDHRFSAITNKERADSSNKSFNLIPISEHNNQQQNIIIEQLLIRKSPNDQMQFGKTDWATGVFIALLILLTYTRITFGKFFRPIFSSVFAFNLSNRIYDEKNIVINRLSTILNFLFVITFTAMLALAFEYYGFAIQQLNKIETYLLLLSFILTIYAIRRLLFFIIGSIFSITETLQEYSFHGNLFLKLLGMIILPLTITIPYIPEKYAHWLFLLISLLIFLIYIMRIIRTFSITIRKGFSIFYLILYLCALEIGPYIMLMKIIHDSIQG